MFADKRSPNVSAHILATVKYEDLNNVVDYVNKNDFTWKAGINSRFSGLTLA